MIYPKSVVQRITWAAHWYYTVRGQHNELDIYLKGVAMKKNRLKEVEINVGKKSILVKRLKEEPDHIKSEWLKALDVLAKKNGSTIQDVVDLLPEEVLLELIVRVKAEPSNILH